MKKLLLLLFLVCISSMLAACASEADDGKREPISAKEVDWSYFLKEGNESNVYDIQLDGESIDDVKKYHELLVLIDENKEQIKEEVGYMKVYVRFNKLGNLTQANEVNKYDGKETTFYLEKTIFSSYLKQEFLKNKFDILFKKERPIWSFFCFGIQEK